MEECLGLAKQAANDEDRGFWQRLAESWHERLRQLQRPAPPAASKGRAVRTAKQGGLGDWAKLILADLDVLLGQIYSHQMERDSDSRVFLA